MNRYHLRQLNFNVTCMHLSGFIKQKSYEKIVYVLRRHPITFVPQVVMFVLLLAVPVGLYYLINSLFPNLLAQEVIYTLGVLFVSMYYLSVYLFFFTQFIEYYLDIWIITNDRMVDAEQLGLFSRRISELDLYQIQDVTSDIHGIIPTFLDYGNLSIKTASMNVGIIAYDIPHPNRVREALIRLADEDRKHHHNGMSPTTPQA